MILNHNIVTQSFFFLISSVIEKIMCPAGLDDRDYGRTHASKCFDNIPDDEYSHHNSRILCLIKSILEKMIINITN